MLEEADGAVLVPPSRVFLEFLRLGLTAFGGPIAHIGYLRAAFVDRLKWIDEASFADLFALCQFLPGPTSSQLGMAIGMEKAGLGGAIAAFLGFTLPAALLMTSFALGLAALGGSINAGVLAGLGIVAVAIVFDAVRSMAVTLARGRLNGAIALAAAVICLILPGSAAQIGVLFAGGLLGLAFGVVEHPTATGHVSHHAVSRGYAVAALALFGLLLMLLPLAASAWASPTLHLLSALYRAGALVFGGGHVVLPLLQDAVVGQGFMSLQTFMAGYGAVQAVPGPLFSFAAFLGATALSPPLAGAALATLVLFAPAFLLIVGIMPFWQRLRRVEAIRRALSGVNAAVVGLLAAALYDPIFITAIHGARDMALAVVCFGLVTVGRVPAWLVVPFAGLAGWAWLSPPV